MDTFSGTPSYSFSEAPWTANCTSSRRSGNACTLQKAPFRTSRALKPSGGCPVPMILLLASSAPHVALYCDALVCVRRYLQTSWREKTVSCFPSWASGIAVDYNLWWEVSSLQDQCFSVADLNCYVLIFDDFSFNGWIFVELFPTFCSTVSSSCLQFLVSITFMFRTFRLFSFYLFLQYSVHFLIAEIVAPGEFVLFWYGLILGSST